MFNVKVIILFSIKKIGDCLKVDQITPIYLNQAVFNIITYINIYK